MLILGIDLGQSKSAWELQDTCSGAVSRGQVQTEEGSLRKLLLARRPEQLVIECGPLAARVYDLAQTLGIVTLVADTSQDAWQWKNVKRKTDADDAGKLVRLAALGHINPVHMPAPPVRERRQLLEYRRALVSEQTRCKNRIRALLLVHGRKLPAGKNGWSQVARQGLRAQAGPLASCEPQELWRGMLTLELDHLQQIEGLVASVTGKLDALGKDDPQIRRVCSIGGVGPRTAETIVAILDDPKRFHSRRQVAAYAGLVPRRYQSGQMDRSGRITKRGSSLLRQTLNQAAWAAVRCNPELRRFYLQVGGGQKKRRKQAIVAVMRKLLVIAWALLRDRTLYQPQRLRPRTAAVAA